MKTERDKLNSMHMLIRFGVLHGWYQRQKTVPVRDGWTRSSCRLALAFASKGVSVAKYI